jgi:hypothetical protein
MIAGRSASYSFFGGAIVAWAIIGPAIVAAGDAFGTAVSPDHPGYMNYMSMVLDDPVNKPSPRYWLVWPGTMLLLAGSFAEVFANYRAIGNSFAQLFAPLFHRLRRREIKINEEGLIPEPCTPAELVSWWMWLGGIGESDPEMVLHASANG